MSDKKVCQVCRRPICGTAKTRKRCQMKGGECHGGGGCTSLGYERLAAILTPEVLRLIEAGRALQEAARREDEAKRRVRAGPQDKASLAAMYKATEDVGGALGHLCGVVSALPFEKPADKRNG